MKKILSVILCGLLLAGVCSCSKPSEEGAKDSFSVLFQNDCDVEIYGVSFTYSVGGKVLGSGGIVNADGTPIARGEALTQSFGEKELSEHTDFSDFSLKLRVIGKDKSEYPCEGDISWAAQYTGEYRISVKGSYEHGFSAQLAN